MVFYEPDTRDRELLPHDPFKAFIAPRPIGWISTLGPAGEVNLAPYSYFNAVCDRPPMVMFSSSGPKDSATYAGSGGEFVWNLATYDLREQMNLTSKELPRGESEFEFGGLEMAPSRLVAPPRVAASPVALECRVVAAPRDRRGATSSPSARSSASTSTSATSSTAAWTRRGMRPIARCGYRGDYAVVTELFEMIRP